METHPTRRPITADAGAACVREGVRPRNRLPRRDGRWRGRRRAAARHFPEPPFGRFAVSLPFVNYGGLLRHGAGPPSTRSSNAPPAWPANGGSPRRAPSRSRGGARLTARSTRWGCGWICRTTWRARGRTRSQGAEPGQEGREERATARGRGVELLQRFYSVFSRNMRDPGHQSIRSIFSAPS